MDDSKKKKYLFIISIICLLVGLTLGIIGIVTYFTPEYSVQENVENKDDEKDDPPIKKEESP